MYLYWKKKTQQEINQKIQEALQANINFYDENLLGVPASHLDDKVFNPDNTILKDSSFLSILLQNPNHIGCHTLGESEAFFSGSQKIEKELIDICALDILKGEPDQHDGYVAAGGTEANIQAIWIYRNYFKENFGATNHEICIICSEDSHYSMDKASNLLTIDLFKIPVDQENRSLPEKSICQTIQKAKQKNKKHFIVISNMMTTMFGSVDDVDLYVKVLQQENCNFKIHIDGAFGGFYFPFTVENNAINFQHPYISSFTLDAHKMAQAPYGTGIFIIRKGYMGFVNTKEASYVEGNDITLSGSRSGANAVAVWMILAKHGPYGWFEKTLVLQKRTEWMCKELGELNIDFFRHPFSNIITIKSTFITNKTASKFGLIPDNHHEPKWFKIIIMNHVTIEKLILLLNDLKK